MKQLHSFFTCRRSLALLALGAAMSLAPIAQAQYVQHNLVSDGFNTADLTDPNLVNAWGLAAGPTSPWWVADNGSSQATVYDQFGNTLRGPVSIPPTNSAPTGAVFNGTSDFMVSANGHSGPARFIFDTENGVISGWSPAADANNAITAVDSTGFGAVYKGLAIGSVGGASRLYATDFSHHAIDVYNGSFGYMGSFTDTTLPRDYSPFNVQAIGGSLFVSYALSSTNGHDDIAGPGNGFVDIFNMDGTFQKRLVSNGPLNSPWGMALAPSNFGALSGDLLVGNFGDGTINAFNPTTGAFAGTLNDVNGQPIVIDGLWALEFGNGGVAGPTNTLFFTAGTDGESHGLFGRIDTVPEPTSLIPLALGALALLRRRRR